METIKLSSSEISRLPFIDEGAEGKVYRYSDDLAIKVLGPKGMELYNEASFFEILGIENETCVFPLCRVEVDGSFQGHAMQYVNGNILRGIAKKLNLNALINAILKADNDLKLLSSIKIKLNEINSGSLLITKDGRLKIVDTDGSRKCDKETQEEIYVDNSKRFNGVIELDTGFLEGPLYEYLNCNEEFAKCYVEYVLAPFYGQSISITVIFRKAMDVFIHEFGIVPHTIEDMENILKGHNLYNQDYDSETHESGPKDK